MPMSAAEKLQKRTKRRNTNVDTVNTLSKNAEDIIEKIIASNKLDDELISIQETIIEKVNRVKELNDEILDLLETTNADDELFEEEENRSTQFSLSSKTILRKINRIVDTFSSDKTDTSSTMTSKSFTVRLPKIEIKPFNGEVEKWNEFWDSYLHAIHDSDCSNAQKMTYLKSLLSGPAAATISGFKTTDENYALAINLLKERYDNKQYC